jgi:predicted AlkP superfamily phosphohydrolase/phosphomutase
MTNSAAPGVSPSTRVLVLGLDMGDGGVIRHLSRQGRLPNLAALASSGAEIDLESTAEVLHTSTWPTFATGTLPGRHGVYYPYQPQPGHQLAPHISPDQYGTPTFWMLAHGRGRRCLVYDIPETFPEPQFGGSAIFDWGTWAWYGTPSAQPAGLLKELKARFGRYPLGYEAKQVGSGSLDARRLEERLLRSVRYKARTARWLLERQECDLAVIGFCETHPAGHYLWPPGADTVDGGDDAMFQPLFNVYAALDEAVGALRDGLPADVAVMVVSGDGVRPNRCAWHLLPAVLERLGFTRPTTGRAATPSSGSGLSLLARLRRAVPEPSRRRITGCLPWWLRDRLATSIQASQIDWSETRAFTLPTDLEGCIRINLRGREPQGIVEPGAQYVELCQEIKARLEELINPATEAPAARRVWIRNEVFPGDRQEHLPDLVVTWNDDAPFTALASPRFGVVEGVSSDPRPGTHSTRGFLLAGGAPVSRGYRGRGHLADVAPTVLELLGLGPAVAMDGRPLTAAPSAGARGVGSGEALSRGGTGL